MATLTFPTPTQLKNLIGPTAATDCATKAYVDNNLGSGSFGNITLRNANISTNLANSSINLLANGTGNVRFVVNSNTWTFSNDGNLVFPANSFDVNYANGGRVGIDTANYATLAGQLVNASQPNITSLGSLSNANVIGELVVHGNANIQGSSANLNLGNTTTNELVEYLANNQTGFNVDGAGVKVGSTGSIAFDYDYSNSAWRSSVNLRSSGNIRGANLSTTGTTTTATFRVLDKSNLNDISNVKIFGGTNGQALVSDGNGGLSWYTRSDPANVSFVNSGNSNLFVTSSGGNITVSSNGVANVLTVTSGGAVTSRATQANGFISNSDLTITSYTGAPRGGQAIFAYPGQTVTGYGSIGSWAFGVDDGNGITLTSRTSTGSGNSAYLFIPGLSGTFNNMFDGGNFNITGNLSGPLFNSARNGTITGNVFTANVRANTNMNVSDTVTATIVWANNNGTGNNLRVGDDAWIGDINQADTVRIRGQQNGNNGYVVFGTGNTAKLGRAGTGPLSYEGTFRASGVVGTGDKLFANGYGMILNSVSGGTEGSQIVMAYTGVSGITSQATATWNLDVDSGNTFRMFTERTDGTALPVRTISADRRVVGLASLRGSFFTNQGPGSGDCVVDNLSFIVINQDFPEVRFKLYARTSSGSSRISWGTITINGGISGNNGNNVDIGPNGSGVLPVAIGDNLWNSYGSVSIAIVTDLNSNRTYRVFAMRVDNYSGSVGNNTRYSVCAQRIV